MAYLQSKHEKLHERALGVGESIYTEEPREIVNLLSRGKLTQYVHPDKISARNLCVIREALSWHSNLIDTMFAMQGLGSYPITLAGNASQKKKYVHAAADGKKIAAFAITETEAGSDVKSMQTMARKVKGGWSITGQKTFISNAGVADFYTLFARSGKDEYSAFIVDADSDGLKLEEAQEVIAPHPIGTLSFKKVFVPDRNLLGKRGHGLRVALGTLELFRVTVAAAAVGLAQRALDEALEYTSSRKQFGRSLSDFQGTQFRLAEMKTELDAARLLVQRAAASVEAGGDEADLESSIAKLYATEAAQRIIDSAVQLHGGRGVLVGEAVERLYREIRALRIYEGTSEIQKVVIGRRLIKDLRNRQES